jgi:chromosome segregation and condensation protein ScpB
MAIVAYKQHVARSAIERIRGSNRDSALDPLLTREIRPGSG